MYYVTSKTVAGAKVKFFESANKRDVARKLAAQRGNATVRTQEEVNKLLAAGAIIGLPGTETNDRAAGTKSAAPATIADIAADVAKSVKSRKTMGKKEKGAKRVETSEANLAEARTFLGTLRDDVSKVDTVRALAAYVTQDGTKLQRRDAIKLLHAEQPAWEIAVHTVSTQWQLVRSGKLTVNPADFQRG